MKSFKTFTLLSFCMALLFVASSCVVVKKDNGKHRGWFKNRNNPHHPNSTKKGKSKQKKNKLTAEVLTIEKVYQWKAIKPY